MKILNLSANKINGINILENVNFKELESLNLFKNEIWNIDVLEKLKFEKLKVINIRGNRINVENNSFVIENLKSKYKHFIY